MRNYAENRIKELREQWRQISLDCKRETERYNRLVALCDDQERLYKQLRTRTFIDIERHLDQMKEISQRASELKRKHRLSPQPH